VRGKKNKEYDRLECMSRKGEWMVGRDGGKVGGDEGGDIKGGGMGRD